HPAGEEKATKPTLKVIWERFPKFVIGFIAASLIFSFFVPTEVNAAVKGSLKNLQGLWFALAFTSIGLETNFKDLFGKNSKKPFYAFLIAQGFNVIVTLIIAFLLFG
ncbi:MAG TPA: putative sulfate exporter family transporter, partial [Pedobacter sp.]